MTEKRTTFKRSTAKEVCALIGLAALMSPYLILDLVGDVSPLPQLLVYVMYLVLTFGGLALLMYGIHYPSTGSQREAKGKPARPANTGRPWKLPPEAADEPVYDLSRNASGSSVGISDQWQFTATSDKFRYMPDRIYEKSRLRWTPGRIVLVCIGLVLLVALVPIEVATSNAVRDSALETGYRLIQFLLFFGALLLLLGAVPQPVSEQPTPEQRKQLKKDRDYFRRKRRF